MIDKAKLFNEILPAVEKPGRYIGQEFNSIKKEPANVKARMVLAYPDLYDVGMSYYGFQILYHILNKDPDIAAERVYAPWPDMEQAMRTHGIPLFTLENHLPVNSFDLVGFSLSYELCYSNVLNMLDLAGIPLFTKDRTDDTPLIVAGGTSAYNPEPLADFIDFFVIGDGEEILPEIAKFVAEERKKKISRQEILNQLAQQFSGVYVPSLYTCKENYYSAHEPMDVAVPEKVTSNRIFHLKPENYPDKPLVPLVEIAQDRLVLEIMRGCTQGCRFCHAGMVYRPIREREPEDLKRQLENSLPGTGYEDVTLLSLSTSDYTGLQQTFSLIKPIVRQKKLSVSLPSLRLDTFDEEMAWFAKMTRKSGLTFAPEAGSQRLRQVINKHISEEQVFESVKIAVENGWRHLKFYFMIGLPTETDEDLQAIVDLIREVLRVGGKQLNVSVTLSSFIPKPFTPFQWEAQPSVDELQRKLDFIKPKLRELRRVKVMSRDPRYSQLESVVSRGDRRVGKVIYEAWKRGAKFDAWSEHFSLETWDKAFEKCGIDPVFYSQGKALDKALPWDVIDALITKKFLLKEREKSLKAEETQDCRFGCTGCGVCTPDELQMIIAREKQADLVKKDFSEETAKREAPQIQFRYRVNYRKTEAARFTSHLDTLRILTQALLRIEAPMVYTQGFNQKPKLSAGYALPFNCTSDDEFLEVYLAKPNKGRLEKLNDNLPEGIRVKSIEMVPVKAPAISSIVTGFDYQVNFHDDEISDLAATVADFIKKDSILIERERKGKVKTIDLRPFVTHIKIIDKGLEIGLKVTDGRTVKIAEILPLLGIHSTSHHIHRSKTHYLKN